MHNKKDIEISNRAGDLNIINLLRMIVTDKILSNKKAEGELLPRPLYGCKKNYLRSIIFLTEEKLFPEALSIATTR